MISRPTGAEECFVYVTLPGETAAITAGRYVRETLRCQAKQNRDRSASCGFFSSVRLAYALLSDLCHRSLDDQFSSADKGSRTDLDGAAWP